MSNDPIKYITHFWSKCRYVLFLVSPITIFVIDATIQLVTNICFMMMIFNADTERTHVTSLEMVFVYVYTHMYVSIRTCIYIYICTYMYVKKFIHWCMYMFV